MPTPDPTEPDSNSAPHTPHVTYRYAPCDVPHAKIVPRHRLHQNISG